jgi:hypothetical protein
MPVMTDVRRALDSAASFEGIHKMLECHIDDAFAAARLGLNLGCEVWMDGDPNPDRAGCKLSSTNQGTALQCELTRWQKYEPGESDSDNPFAGHTVAAGAIYIQSDGDFFVGLKGLGYHEVLNPACLDMLLYGNDSAGRALSVKLTVVRI